MKALLKVGLAIGILTACWQLIMIAAGWLTNPRTSSLFYIVILIQIAILIWGMRQTAASKTYGAQLGFGTAASLVAGIFLFAYSLILMTVLFPNLIGEIKTMQAEALKKAGTNDAQISAAMALQTPMVQSIMGFLGTVVTGFLASAIIAIFVRKK